MPARPEDSAEPLEIISHRHFGTPREKLFEMFRNPNHLVHWWGPEGFSNTFQEFDLRPGGSWLFTMEGPDGQEFHNVKEFTEVRAPEQITLRHLSPIHRFEMTMTYTPDEAGTTLTWRMVFEPSPRNAEIEPFIGQANEQNFDRLAAYLTKR